MGRESEGNGGKLDEMEDTPSTPETSLKLLCSSKITEDSQLLHLLESKYNVTILERDYDIFRVCYADVIVDVVNGIVLMTSQDILSTGIEGLTKRVNFLAQQFQKIWIIIREDGSEKSGLQSKAFRKCICQLYSVIAQYTQKEHQYEVKVLFSSSLEEVAEIVKMVCKTAEENMSSVWHKDDWLKRQCITVQPSKHESFLTQFPSVNSFTAQVLLTFAPLRKLLSTPAEDLVTFAPWVPLKFLKTFESYTSCSFDVAGLADDPGDHFSRAAQPSIGSATEDISSEDTLDSHMDVRLKTEPRPPVSPLSNSSLDSPLPVVDIRGSLTTAAASVDPSHSDQLQHSTMSSLERGDGCGIMQASTSYPTRESLFNPSHEPAEDQRYALYQATSRGPAERCHAGTVRSVMEDGNEEQHHHILSLMENIGASDMQNRPSYPLGNSLPRGGSSSLYRKDSVGTEMGGRNITQYHHLTGPPNQDLTRHQQAASSYQDPRSHDERTALELLHAGRFEVGAGDSTGGNTSVGQATRLSEQQAVRYRDSVHLRRSIPVGRIPMLPEPLSVNYSQGLPGEYDGGSDWNGIHQLRGSAPGMAQRGTAPETVQRGTAQEMIRGVEYPQVRGPAPEMIRRVDNPQVRGTVPEMTQRGTAPGISQRVDYLQESRDPFQRIKDDCLRQLNTGAGRRVNLLPPLMTRTRDVQQQRSVVRPFHQAGQLISQDNVQGYLHDDPGSTGTRYGRAPPDGALFDESGWKRRLQPGPSSGGGQTSSTHAGIDHLQPSGYSTSSSSATKHRRLAYQRDPTSSDGQTKLTFLS